MISRRHLRVPLAALCVAALALVVFLPAGEFSFVPFDDDAYVAQNALVRDGLSWRSAARAFTSVGGGELDPRDLALAHGRRFPLRLRRRPAPPGERGYPRGVRGAALSRAARHDRGGRPERTGRGALRDPPAARGVRRLGRGAQGRPGGVLLGRRDGGLAAVRPPARPRPLPPRLRRGRPRADGQADGGDDPFRAAAARSLAARALAARGADAGAPTGRTAFGGCCWRNCRCCCWRPGRPP